ncbi:2,5-diketo-D-gluconic acid reductase [Helicobacter didelphidarum]|uniref:2,5-diketo-D-gluconic acid reductase n=1 Tax=Helicobacter didelphidarum TaxID=2040648 RepID=A0A3D8IIU7_9HELI|nr:aldo/keto reductase [Helicobacter didelphidarum]RDU64960.1 2,5-diketo-D-gluconic acid reductase [Helicobacter didelphidarum]
MEYITLTIGVKMPILGFGTFQIEPKDTQRCVEDAIEVGYRSIDTAAAYFNEEGVGNALQTALKGGIKREDLFITTKLWISDTFGYKPHKAFESSLKKLGLDYVDLYIIHMSYGDVYNTWRTMSKIYHNGLVKAIGVSNFTPIRLSDFCLYNEIKPALNQVECHPFFAQFDAQKNMQDLGVVMQSWASFAEGKNDFFTNKILSQIGAKYHKSNAQVALRWLIERGIVVIPKTTRKERMIENFNVFDFKLDSSDMAMIAKLDTNKSLFLDHEDPATIEYLHSLHKGKI